MIGKHKQFGVTGALIWIWYL